MENAGDFIHYLNVAYFLRLLYDSVFGASVSGVGIDGGAFGIVPLFSAIWTAVTVLAYIISLGALILLVFTTIRMRQIFEDEHHLYSTLSPDEAERRTDNSRWEHIISLIESPQESDWRQAIVEADIMLDEMLVERKYEGETTLERLERADPSSFKSLMHAKEAHKVRNEIAHYGATYHLEDNLAYRTIKNYETVFLEFGEIDVNAKQRAQSYAHASA